MKKSDKKKLLCKKTLQKWVVIILLLTGLLLLRVHTANSNNPDKKIQPILAADIRSIHISFGKGSVYIIRSLTDDLTVRLHSGPGSIFFRPSMLVHMKKIRIRYSVPPFWKEKKYPSLELCVPASYTGKLDIDTSTGVVDGSNTTLTAGKIYIDSSDGTILLNTVSADSVILKTTNGSITCNAASGNILLETTNGCIRAGKLSGSIPDSVFRAVTTRGSISLDTVCSENVYLESTNGQITCGKVNGKVSYISTSGSLRLLDASGNGTFYSSHAGLTDISYTQASDSISVFNRHGTIRCSLPAENDFLFSPLKSEINDMQPFPGKFSVNGKSSVSITNAVRTVRIKLETENGNIYVSGNKNREYTNE